MRWSAARIGMRTTRPIETEGSAPRATHRRIVCSLTAYRWAACATVSSL